MITPTLRASIRKPNSEGLVTATGGNDLMHTLGRNRSGVHRTAIIRKIMAYNNTGANVTIQLGTRDGTAPAPLFVAYLPVLLVLNGMENIWGEEHIPAVEFSVVDLTAADYREGNVYLLASDAGIEVSLEIEEFGS